MLESSQILQYGWLKMKGRLWAMIVKYDKTGVSSEVKPPLRWLPAALDKMRWHLIRLRGQSQVPQSKSNWGSPSAKNMKPVYIFLSLTYCCRLTEPTEMGRVVGFFLYFEGSTALHSSARALHSLYKGWPKGSSSPPAQTAGHVQKWHVQENGWWQTSAVFPPCSLMSLMAQCFRVSVFTPRAKKERLSPVPVTPFSGAEGQSSVWWQQGCPLP